jgi:hypothetical protein
VRTHALPKPAARGPSDNVPIREAAA